MVEKWIKGFSDIVHTIGAAFVVYRTALFLDADDGQIHAFEVGELILVAVDVNRLAQGLLARTVGLAETLLSYRLKENADVHYFGLWPMTMAYGLWQLPLRRGFTPLVEASHRPFAISHS